MKWIFRMALVAALMLLPGILFVFKAPNVALQAIMAGERSQAGLQRKMITLDGGEHFAYLEGGQGEALMLIHGFGANKDAFTRVAKLLTPHYRVIIPDLTGFGESSRPSKADYRTAAQVERLHRLTLALGVQGGLHLGGSSMGWHIAMAWASIYPQEIRSMWLLDPGGVWSAPKSELMKNYEATGKMPLIAATEDAFLALPGWTMSKPPYAPEVLLRAMSHENIPYKDMLTAILKQVSVDAIEPHLKGVTTPTLLVWGAEDRVLSVETVPVLQKLLPQAKVIVMKGIGHLPMMEDVAQSASDYLAFRAHLNTSPPKLASTQVSMLR